MDQGSYSRAYEYIVRYVATVREYGCHGNIICRLHMLKELEQGVNKLQLLHGGEVDEESKKELTSVWNERFQFIQVVYTGTYILCVLHGCCSRLHFTQWSLY